MHTPKAVTIPCADGYPLSGTLFVPESVRAAVLIGPATGIKRGFYRHFAGFLADNGYATLTFENRGIGDSKGRTFEDGDPSLVRWGQLDMTAALAFLMNSFPNTDYHLVGHSAGGQLVGLMDNALELTSMFNVACSSGSVQYAKYPFKILSRFFLNVFIPTSNLLFGHTKAQWMGMGEPLPKKVAQQWRTFCNAKGYVANELGTSIQDHHYDNLTFPTQWLYATDDDIANRETVDDMIRVFLNIRAEVVVLDPRALGFQAIGHMNFFRKEKKVLWARTLQWLAQFTDSQQTFKTLKGDNLAT